jgi:hypothetical protein
MIVPLIPLKEYDLPIKKKKKNRKGIPCFMFGLLMKKAKGIPFSFQFFFGCRQANGFMGKRKHYCCMYKTNSRHVMP